MTAPDGFNKDSYSDVSIGFQEWEMEIQGKLEEEGKEKAAM